MNDDIVQRLREGIASTNHFGIVDAEQVMEAAAKEIERLRSDSCKNAEIEQMKAAIEGLQRQLHMHSEIIEIMLTNKHE